MTVSAGERLSARLLMKTTLALPANLASSMRDAIDGGTQRIEPGRYDDGSAMCPLAAADAVAESRGGDRFPGWAPREDYGARLVRFARAFDLCAQQYGSEFALGLLGVALSRRLS